MFFTEIVEQVMQIVARPDREDEIKIAVNAVLSQCILGANFYGDLVETSIVIDPTLYGATIPFLSEVERFRKFKYIKPYGVKRYLKQVDSDKIFTPGNVIQKDTFYLAGSNITYVLNELAPSLEIGYYQYPITLDGITENSFWFLDVAPYCVIDKAAARLFRSIGDEASASAYERSGKTLYDTARNDFVDGVLARAQ